MNWSYFPAFIVQTPWAFVALLALIVPLVLHLISKSQPVKIKFSNIALIDVKQPKSMRQVRLTEFWLLLLRLLLLLFSVLLLADVFLTKPLIKNEEINIVTLDWLHHSNTRQRQQLIEQALNKPIYLLANNTELMTEDELLQWPQQLGITQDQNILLHLAYFSQLLAPETGIQLFVTDRAAQYQLNETAGNISLNNAINWHILALPYKDEQQYPDPMNVVLVYDQSRLDEVKYFEKAFALIKEKIAPKLTFSSFTDQVLESSEHYQQVLNNKADWLFYLTTKPLDQKTVQALQSGTTLFVDGQNPTENILLRRPLSIHKHSAMLFGDEIRFYQVAIPVAVAAPLINIGVSRNPEVLWEFTQPDGTNLPMLTSTRLIYPNQGTESTVFHLYSRFTPTWSNMMALKQFPLILQQLLFQRWQESMFAQHQILQHEKIRQLVTLRHNLEEGSAENKSNNKNSNNKNSTEKASLDNARAKLNIKGFKQAKSLLVEQQSYDYWRELLAIIMIFLWTIERIISERYSPNNRKAPQVKSEIPTQVDA